VKLRPRLIPSVILAATILLGLKVSDIFSVGSHALAQAPSSNQATGAPLDLTSEANAVKPPATPAPAKSPEPAAPKQAAASASPPQGAAPQEAAAATAPSPQPEGAAKPAAQPEAATPGGAAKPQAAKSAAQTAEAPPNAPEQRGALKDPLLLSPAEIEILQELSQRRTQLDQRASELDRQQVVLQAAEKRIDQKIAKLEAIQKSIQTAVDKQTATDDARTQNLVKIYETMKPADAAQILSQLSMPDVLKMLTQMKTAKTAPILAAMDPTKAQAITTAMLEKHNPPTAVAAAAPAKP